jgi:hypothetical protein
MRTAEVTFRAGPLLGPPTAVTLPLPAFGPGDWAWLQYAGPGEAAEPRPLSRADSSAQLVDASASLRDGWLSLRLSPQASRLTYSLTPSAVRAGTGSDPTATSVTITAYNGTSVAVSCTSIGIVLPTGTGQAALTSQPDLIQPASGQPGSWALQAAGPSQPGTFIATPVAAGTTVDPGATLSFVFANVDVSPDQGLAAVTIEESADGARTTITLALEKFSPPPVSAPGTAANE